MIETAIPIAALSPDRSGLSDRECVFMKLTAYLNGHKVAYVVMDVFCLDGDKIDYEFIVAPETLGKMTPHINAFCKENDLIPVQKIRSSSSASLYILAWYDPSGNKLEFCRIRISSAYKVGEYCFSSDELLRNKSYVCNGDYWKLTYAYAFISTFLHSIKVGHVGENEFSVFTEQWHCSKSNIKAGLSRFFPKGKIDVIAALFDAEDYIGLNNILGVLKTSLRFKGGVHLKEFVFNKINSVRNMFHSPGLVIGLLGRDGSGKSTFINDVTSALGNCFPFIASFKKHPRFFYKAPILNKNQGYHFSKPHFFKARGPFGSFLKLNILLADFLFGYWFKVFPYKRKAFLVLYDRYFIDVLADPLRYRVSGNSFYAKVVHYLLPKPDLWIILDLPSDVLLRRKQELTYEMSEKLRQKYLALESMLPHCIVINNDGDMQETVRAASSFIVGFLNNRFQAQD